MWFLFFLDTIVDSFCFTLNNSVSLLPPSPTPPLAGSPKKNERQFKFLFASKLHYAILIMLSCCILPWKSKEKFTFFFVLNLVCSIWCATNLSGWHQQIECQTFFFYPEKKNFPYLFLSLVRSVICRSRFYFAMRVTRFQTSF